MKVPDKYNAEMDQLLHMDWLPDCPSESNETALNALSLQSKFVIVYPGYRLRYKCVIIRRIPEEANSASSGF